MSKTLAVVILLVAMIALIVGCDVLFLRDRFGLRLAVNVGIVGCLRRDLPSFPAARLTWPIGAWQAHFRHERMLSRAADGRVARMGLSARGPVASGWWC